MDTVLEIDALNVSFRTRESQNFAVRDVSLSLNKGETLGLVGESGCGKSVTAFSVLRLISPPGNIDSGKILYRGRDLLSLSDEEMRKYRGGEIAMIFQEPMTSLNPVFRIGYQISEAIRLHLKKSRDEARDIAIDLLRQVGIPNAEKRYNSYPHELSGGMRQRVMIAMALSAEPEVLIADEPTTALDVTIQAQILDLLLSLQEKRNMSLMLITHDLGIVANVADRVAIMYAGEIVEYGSIAQIYEHPLHPYTAGLFEAIPSIGTDTKRMKTIPGIVPTITETPVGCVFYPRCSRGDHECTVQRIPLIEKSSGQLVRCIKA
ncbi:MAG TPA: ABC transporter ATP-binding protein [Spirochaetota bacterium]|nr:ABC transporter ATP-binding protein [Spirochaetota bacterium]HPQ53811.1 ABC transporter ATP-binding protein [Spirochaetota bacterium]